MPSRGSLSNAEVFTGHGYAFSGYQAEPGRALAFAQLLGDLSHSEVLPLTDAVVQRAAAIYGDLHQRGQLIGDADILVAATAMENGLLCVTNNENHFKRIPNLLLDNWLKP